VAPRGHQSSSCNSPFPPSAALRGRRCRGSFATGVSIAPPALPTGGGRDSWGLPRRSSSCCGDAAFIGQPVLSLRWNRDRLRDAPNGSVSLQSDPLASCYYHYYYYYYYKPRPEQISVISLELSKEKSNFYGAFIAILQSTRQYFNTFYIFYLQSFIQIRFV
jgi:hypothetical protein